MGSNETETPTTATPADVAAANPPLEAVINEKGELVGVKPVLPHIGYLHKLLRYLKAEFAELGLDIEAELKKL